MIKVLLTSFMLAASMPAWADEIVKDLPAGGTFTYKTKWDNITVNCTADPVTPSVIAKSCTCTQYDRRPYTGDYKFRLTLSSLLSNGKTVDLPLADALETMGDCEAQKKEYADTCKK